MMKTILALIFTMVFFTLSLFAFRETGFTQDDDSPPALYAETSNGARQNTDKRFFDITSEEIFQDEQPLAPFSAFSSLVTGGPDVYGYTWDDSVALNWIDATDGTDTGMSGSSQNQAIGPVPLPFTFDYYENSYSNVYIAASGYLSFNDWENWPWQPVVPLSMEPNNIIAPYATPLDLAATGPANRIYYKNGGVAPNRYFVVEWYQVERDNEVYTFEVILYENGDILFQYQDMVYVNGYSCGSIGIEDVTGLDGLKYRDFCERAPSNTAVRYFRPLPAVRMNVNPLYQGQFTRPGETVSYQLQVRHTGDLGADTFDLLSSSAWPLTLYTVDGVTPLTDTDGDGIVDSGLLNKGDEVTVTVKVQTPVNAYSGDDNVASITVRSSLDSSVEMAARLPAAIPAPFAQVFRDNVDDAMSFYLAQPLSQTAKTITPDRYYGNYVAVAEMPNNQFVYAWVKGRCVDTSSCNVYVREIEYTFLDQVGRTVRTIDKLTDHSSAVVDTQDESLAVAVTPDGRVGLLWYRYLYNVSTSQISYDIYFAILNASGSLLYGPVNVTDSNIWGAWNDLNVPRFYQPRLAATSDNRFVLAWRREHQESDGYVTDIYYMVRGNDGAPIGEITKLTNDTPGTSGYYDPVLTMLSSNRVFLSWVDRQDSNDDIYFVVIDSNGDLAQPATNLSIDESVVDWRNYDAVQLSDGKIFVAWEAWGCFPDEWTSRIRFVLLDASYNRIGTPVCLGRADVSSGDSNVSVAADGNGRAILTWVDKDWQERKNLYYALVDSNGSILTPPMVFLSSQQAILPRIESSYGGYGNTSYNGWLSKLFLPVIAR